MCNKSHDFDAEARRSAGDGAACSQAFICWLLSGLCCTIKHEASAWKDISIFKASLMSTLSLCY